MTKLTNKKNSLGILPMGDRVLVKPLVVDEKSVSGIIIPDTVNKEKPEQGVVLSVGEGKYESGKVVPMRVKVGDKVIFSKYGYDEVKIDEEEFYIIKEENILAVIK